MFHKEYKAIICKENLAVYQKSLRTFFQAPLQLRNRSGITIIQQWTSKSVLKEIYTLDFLQTNIYIPNMRVFKKQENQDENYSMAN